MIRLLLMAGFFFGLFILVRMREWWHIPVGVLLMVMTVPLNDRIMEFMYTDRSRHRKLGEHLERSIPFILPIALFTLAFGGIGAAASYQDGRFFYAYLLAGIPLIMIIIKAVHGEIPWEPAAILNAFIRLVTYQIGKIALVLGTVFSVLVLGVFGTLTLLITLINLAWQLLDASDDKVTPFFCTEYELGNTCLPVLTGWHFGQLLLVWLMLKYGERVFNWMVDRLVVFRD